MKSPEVESYEQLKAHLGEIINVHKLHHSKLSALDRLALIITDKVGTMGFFFVILAWTICWLSWNIFAPVNWRFDPFPAFVLWLFISNLIQIHLMPLIMVGQNLQGKHAQLQSEHDLQTDQKAEKEIESILLHLENQQELILEILKKLEDIKKN